MFKQYYHLAKPGIIYGNALTAIAGFFFATHGKVNLGLFIAMLAGLSLIIASGCVINNYFDRDVDAKMERTKNRALVKNTVGPQAAIIYATILLILGFIILLIFTNKITLLTALLGFCVYVLIYTPLKRKSIHATLIGAISGATPPVIGYTAVTQKLDLSALILFLILICWQMPHFYSIAIYRLKDYAAANIPVWPVKKGVTSTKIQILFYCVLFAVACLALSAFTQAGMVYTITMGILSLGWFIYSIKGFNVQDEPKWARKMFLFSLIIITLLSLVLSINNIL